MKPDLHCANPRTHVRICACSGDTLYSYQVDAYNPTRVRLALDTSHNYHLNRARLTSLHRRGQRAVDSSLCSIVYRLLVRHWEAFSNLLPTSGTSRSVEYRRRPLSGNLNALVKHCQSSASYSAKLQFNEIVYATFIIKRFTQTIQVCIWKSCLRTPKHYPYLKPHLEPKFYSSTVKREHWTSTPNGNFPTKESARLQRKESFCRTAFQHPCILSALKKNHFTMTYAFRVLPRGNRIQFAYDVHFVSEYFIRYSPWKHILCI